MNANPAVIYNPVPARFRLLSGSALKIAAVVTMLIDHIGAGILYPYLLNRTALFSLTREQSILLYRVFRHIGRTAFPVYCFLLVEGFFYTKSRLRYLIRMFVFSLVSELPFNLALVPGNSDTHTLHILRAYQTNRDVFFREQNVFFTLFIGLAVIWMIDASYARAAKRAGSNASLRIPYTIAAAMVGFLAFAAGCFLAYLHQTDYGHKGVVLITVLYLLRRIRPLALAAGYGYFTYAMPNEAWSLPAFALMLFYNGKRGFIGGRFKYFFYVFYPAHLMVIYVVRTFIL